MASPLQESRLDPDIGPERQDAPNAASVGNLLRRKREEYGQDLDAIAARLRIRSGYLQAIEEGRFKDLPGSTYAVGFIRTYADHLGLDSQEILRRFREEVAELAGQPQLVFPAAATEGKLPGGAILLLSLLLAAIAYGAWYYLSNREGDLLDMVPAVPERLSTLMSRDAPVTGAVDEMTGAADEMTGAAPGENAAADAVPKPESPSAPAAETETGTAPQSQIAAVAPNPAERGAGAGEGASPDRDATEAMRTESAGSAAPKPAAAPAATETAAPTPARTNLAAATPQPQRDSAEREFQPRTFDEHGPMAIETERLPPPAPGGAGAIPETAVAAIPAAPAVPPASEGGQTFGTANRDSRVTLVARLESWVQVNDANEAVLWTRVLQAGDRYRVPNMAGLTLTTGNAGGLEVLVDGAPGPVLGPVGAVRRGIPLDAERLASGNTRP